MQRGLRFDRDPLAIYAGPVGVDDREDSVRRLEFLCVQGAVLLAPYIAIRPPDLYFTASDALFTAAFFLRFCTGRLVRPFGDLTWAWLLGVALLIGGLFVGSLVNGDLERSSIIILQYGFALVLVPFTVLGRSVDQCIRLIKCSLWGMVIMCLIGIAVYLTGYSSQGGDQFEIVSGNRRLSGFVDNPNGMAVLTVLSIALLWFLAAAGRMKKWASFFCLLVLVAGLILTSSNTGMVGLAVATLVFFVGRRNYKTLVLVAAAGAALLMVGQNYLPETFNNRVLGAVTSGNLEEAGTFSHRKELATEAIAMSEDYIAIGLGADRYRVVSAWGQPVHNTYLLLLVEGGAMSFFGLLLLLATILLVVFTSRARPFGGLVTLTAFTSIIVFANLLNGMPHIYGRCWILPVLLAMSPAVATAARKAIRAHAPDPFAARRERRLRAIAS